MFARLRRTILVLTIIIVAYVAYSVVVVPFVEPSITLSKPKGSSAQPAPRVSRFTELFPAGSWELGRPKEIETEQGTLLFADYKPLADGRMELTKCTIIAQLDNPSSSEKVVGKRESNSRPVIIRAPQGASLKFDRELNLLRGDFGRLEGGEFVGEVSITSPASSPTADDALHLVTKGVQINSEKIWTPHEVRFRYGPNNGVGRVLTIHMHSSRKSQQAELAIGGVRLLELQYLDQLDLMLPDQGLFGRQNPSQNPDSVAKMPATPVQVKCRGPMKFDFLTQLLSLEDQVDLVRLHPGGVRDQLTCDVLQIYFSGRAGKVVTSDESKEASKGVSPTQMTPTRVVATGSPVTIRAAAAGIGAKAGRIEYDCVLQRVWLQDHNKVLMNDRQKEVEAKELQYTLGEGNRLGELWAQGPGLLRGEFGKTARGFDVSWRNEVRLQRIANEPVLSFDAHAKFAVEGFGQFAGDTLHFYLREIPRAGTDDVEVVPDRLHAVGHVEVDTESCQGHMQEAKIWFKQTAVDNAVTAAGYESDQPTGILVQPQAPSARPKSKFDLRAQTVEAVVRMGAKPMADLVIVRGNVELRELGAVKSGPLVIHGEHFELQDGASAHPRAALLGSPAEINARGATARGAKIHLHPADNYLEIVGAGDLSLPGNSQDGASGAPTGISWVHQMQFDGQLARFEKDTVVRGTQLARNGDRTTFVAMGDLVHAELSQRIDFRSINLQAPIELVEAAFEGWAFLQTEMFEPSGGRKVFEQMQVHGLTVNQISGDVHGRGPGWVRGIHLGKNLLPGDPAKDAVPVSTGSELNFLRVDFERELAGNLRQQRLEFRDGTKVLYGPVKNWDDALDQEQSEARPGVMQMTCDWLGIAQKNDGTSNAVELEAVGNAHIQGDLFSATGGRVSYAQAKDQLILEGDGRNDARLEYQADRERPPAQMAAGKILYHPKTRQFQLVDLKQSELYDLGQFRGRSAPIVRPR